MVESKKPIIALVLGDPCGIGPELCAKLLADPEVCRRADIVMIGDPAVFRQGAAIAGTDVEYELVTDPARIAFGAATLFLLAEPVFNATDSAPGQVSEASGRYQLDCLATALNLCSRGIADGLCFAPLNKEALHRAGLTHDDESGFFIDQLGHSGSVGLLNTLGNLWTSRATSHVAHRQVSQLLSKESILEATRLLDSALKASGIGAPEIAVAGLNPHAGDGGTFGTEEIDVIVPAIEQAKNEGINVQGPFPADTIFLMGRDGRFDAIVTMYHDQGQIAMKLMGFDHGVTVHAGLPFPVTTSAHGSAFDIAGKGIASENALKAAFNLACSMTGR